MIPPDQKNELKLGERTTGGGFVLNRFLSLRMRNDSAFCTMTLRGVDKGGEKD